MSSQPVQSGAKRSCRRRADIGGMDGLDAECSHLRRGEVERRRCPSRRRAPARWRSSRRRRGRRGSRRREPATRPASVGRRRRASAGNAWRQGAFVRTGRHRRRRNWPRAAARDDGAPSRCVDPRPEAPAPGSRPAPRRSRSGPSAAAGRGSDGHVALDGGELEGKRRQRPLQAGKHRVLEALHVDLGEGRRADASAISASRVRQGTSPSRPRPGPPSRRRRRPPTTKSAEAVDTVGLADVDAAASARPRRAPRRPRRASPPVAAVDAGRMRAAGPAAARARRPARRGGGSCETRSPTWAPMSKARSPGRRKRA